MGFESKPQEAARFTYIHALDWVESNLKIFGHRK
jgi:hypothetical protein